MIKSIQYLRGLAAILVVFYHSTIKAVQNNFSDAQILYFGQSGVDLFFIISGFIICYVCNNKEFNFPKFIKARIIRIIPLYWFFTFFALIAYITLPSLVNSSGGETKILQSIFLIPTNEKYLVQNGWTLSYEFYFYFLFSIICLLKLQLKWLFIILCILPIVGNTLINNFLFDTFLLEFAMGVISFQIYTANKLLWKQTTIMVLLLLSITVFLGGRVLEYGLIMWFLFQCGLWLNPIIDRYISPIINNLLGFLGDSSYSLYLSHTFSLVLLNKIFLTFLGQFHLYFYLTFLTVSSLIIGGIVYKLIEVPLTKYSKILFK